MRNHSIFLPIVAALFLGPAMAPLAYASATDACVPRGANAQPISTEPAVYGKLNGGRLASEVRNLVSTNPGALDGIKAIVDAAGPSRYGSIGAGLGAAANVCAKTNPDAALAIQQAVLKLDQKDITDAFQSVTGELETTSIGKSPPAPQIPGADGNIGHGPNPGRRDDPNGLAGGVVDQPSPFGIAPSLVTVGGSESDRDRTDVVTVTALQPVSISR